MIIAAPLSARFNERFGTKIVVSAGLLIVAAALTLMGTIQIDTSYSRLAFGIAILGVGMGTAMAPATDSIMGSLPLAKAGVGSAMNDTTRQVGGALGVAVLGSILAWQYGSAIAPAVTQLPAEAAGVASDSIGGALAVASQIGDAASPLVDAAKAAFVEGMRVAVLVAAAVAALGAVVTWLFLPPWPKEAPEPLALDEEPAGG
jgi:sugar phosphate permease